MAEAKKEKKFNGTRIARQVEKSLKAVFPNEKFYVSEVNGYVEIVHFDTATCTPAVMSMFTSIFCTLNNIRKEQLIFTRVKKESAAALAPAK